MVFGFLKRIFSKKKKIDITQEPIIPLHMKEKMVNEKRKQEVNELKKEHLQNQKKKVVADVLAEEIKDKKIKDIDFDDNTVSLFKADGVYSIGPTKIITGFLETGRLKARMKSIVNEVPIILLEIRKDLGPVDDLLPGQEGTLIIKSKKNPLLRHGDYLEFE